MSLGLIPMGVGQDAEKGSGDAIIGRNGWQSLGANWRTIPKM